MSIVERRKQLTEALAKKTEESYDARNDTGRFQGVFKPEVDISQWSCKEGEHALDILPYEVGEGNPRSKKGEIDYVLILWIHENIGVNSARLVCPARNYKNPCPICEERKKLEDGGADEDTIKVLLPKRRCFYNVTCYDSQAEEEKGVQVWEVSHYFMEAHLVELSRKSRGGGNIPFSAPEKGSGKTILFRKEGKGAGNVKYIGHRFEERDYDIPDDVLMSAYCLEDIMHIPTYEELEATFYGRALTHPEVTEPQGGSTRAPRYAEEVPSQPPKEDTKQVPFSEVDRCPYGGIFGEDTDRLEPCARCKVYDACVLARNSAKSNSAPAPESPRSVRRRFRT